MAADLLLKASKHSKYLPYRNFLYHRFFVGLLLFIVISLVLTVVFNAFSGPLPRTSVYESIDLNKRSKVVLSRNAPFSQIRSANCTYWDCFDVYKCGRGGHDKITIYIYPLKDYQTENGNSISQFSREFYLILDTIKRSKYYTTNPEEACLLVPSIDTLNQASFSKSEVSQALQSLSQ